MLLAAFEGRKPGPSDAPFLERPARDERRALAVLDGLRADDPKRIRQILSVDDSALVALGIDVSDISGEWGILSRVAQLHARKCACSIADPAFVYAATRLPSPSPASLPF